MVKWMEEQARLLEKGVLPGGSSGRVEPVVPEVSDKVPLAADSMVSSMADRAAGIHRDPPSKLISKPVVLPDLWWTVPDPVNIDLLTVGNCTLEQAKAYVQCQRYWRVLVDDNLELLLARIRQMLWDDNYVLGGIDCPPYRRWPVNFLCFPGYVVRWMSGGSEIEGRLGYESTAERALVWVGNLHEANELVPWSSLTIGDHWASASEFQRRGLIIQAQREAAKLEQEEKNCGKTRQQLRENWKLL